MKARDVMVAGANVVTVNPDDSIFTAIRLMLKKGISGVPVVEKGAMGQGKLVGIVTEGDFLRRRETNTLRRRPRWLEFLVGPGKLAEEYARGSGRKVNEVMTAPVITTTEDTEVEDIVRLMEQNGVKRVPIVRHDAVVGIVTRADLLRALVREVSKPLPVSAGDTAVRDRLLDELKKQPWGSSSMVDISVKDGAVKLAGVIMDERERAAIVIACENAAGVKSVEDHMAFVEPMSGTVLLSPEDERKAKAS